MANFHPDRKTWENKDFVVLPVPILPGENWQLDKTEHLNFISVQDKVRWANWRIGP